MSDQRVSSLAAEDHLCTTCGLAYAEITSDDAVRTIAGLTGELKSIINGLTDGALHRRPDEGGWSITEYVYHLRDVYITYTIRLHRTRTDEVGRSSAVELQRTATRLPGEQRTGYWLIRQAMHEGVHHLADIRRLADETLG